VDHLNLVVVQESVQEIAGREPESTLEEGGEHHNLFHVRCWDLFPVSRSSLEHCVFRKETVHY
jgi:hypothetical protein